MKNKSWPLLAITCLLILQSCNGKKSQSDQTKEISIGAILPLTGDDAFVGTPIKNAIELKVEDYNKTAAIKIKVIFEDSEGGKPEAVSALEKLNAQGIKAVLGPATSGEVSRVAPTADSDKIILFSPSASAESITSAGDYIFRNELSDQLGAAKQAQLAFNTLNWKKIAILYTNNDYGVGVNKAFEDEFIKLGGIITNSVSFTSGSTDFKTQILKIETQIPDAIFVIAQAEYPIIIKQILESKIKSKIYGTPIFEDPSFIDKLGKENAEGIIYTYYGSFSLDAVDTITKDFISEYTAKYNIAPTYYAALGYDNICILIEALKHADFDFAKLKSALYAVQNFKGVTGEMSFDKNGDVEKRVILKTVKNGAFVNY